MSALQDIALNLDAETAGQQPISAARTGRIARVVAWFDGQPIGDALELELAALPDLDLGAMDPHGHLHAVEVAVPELALRFLEGEASVREPPKA